MNVNIRPKNYTDNRKYSVAEFNAILSFLNGLPSIVELNGKADKKYVDMLALAQYTGYAEANTAPIVTDSVIKYDASAGVTYANFKNSNGTPITIPTEVGGEKVIRASLIGMNGVWNYEVGLMSLDGYMRDSEKGVAGGVAVLDNNSKVLFDQIPDLSRQYTPNGGSKKTTAQIDVEKIDKSYILDRDNPTYGPNLVSGFVAGASYTTSKSTFGEFPSGGRSNWFAVDQGGVYEVTSLVGSLTIANWGRCFNSVGNTVYTLTSGDIQIVNGKQWMTIPMGLGIVEAGLNIHNADQSGFMFRHILSGSGENIRESVIPDTITRNADILNQTNDPGEPNNQYTGLQTGAWDPNTAVGTPAVINNTVAYASWRAGALFPVITGQTWMIENRNEIGSNFGVFYDASSNKVANAANTLLTKVGEGSWIFTIPAGVARMGIHTYNAAPYPSDGVSVTRPSREVGKINRWLLPATNGVDGRKKLAGPWNACGTSLTFYDGTVYASGPQQGETTRGYQTWVQDNVTFSDGVRNYGLGGHSWAINPANANTIVLKMGGWQAAKWWTAEGPSNDFKLNVVIGVPNDYINNTGAGTLYGAMRIFVDKVYSLQADSVIIFITDPHRDNDGYTSYSTNTLGNTLEDYNDVFRWVSDRVSAPLCDTFRNSGINDYNLMQYTRDGLHPIDSGYRLMARELITIFKDI